MPRYFFNIEDHVKEDDDQGVELPDAAVARREAIVFAGSLLKEEPDMVWDGSEFAVKVTDEEGRPVLDVFVRAHSR